MTSKNIYVIIHKKECLSIIRCYLKNNPILLIQQCKMNYDDILVELGELGPWQILHCILLWIPSITSGMLVLTYSFSGK